MLLASLVALWLMSDHTDRMLVGDPAEYRERVDAILTGGWPYLDVPFEHLPVMLLPMLGAWFLGGGASQTSYVVVFVLLMAVVMAAATWLVDSLGERLQVSAAGGRWLLITVPMLPLVLFRNDPFSVLLGIGAVSLVTAGSPGWAASAIAGALAKVWPAVIALLAWPRRKIGAMTVALAGVVGFGITLLPGFTERRDAVGIHTETLLGGMVGLRRTLAGGNANVAITTAAYLEVEPWVVALNALAGLLVVGLGIRSVVTTTHTATKVVRLGTVVTGVILVSPLFSLQYVLWVMPFLVMSRRGIVAALGFVLALVTMWLGWVWDPPILETSGFYLGVCVRNVLLLATAVLLSYERPPDSGDLE